MKRLILLKPKIMIMYNQKIYGAFFILSIIIGCENKSKKNCGASFEIIASAPNDTVNRKDCNGMKQGKWVPTPSNGIKDTFYYKNDKLLK